jgi:hypothetical protein
MPIVKSPSIRTRTSAGRSVTEQSSSVGIGRAQWVLGCDPDTHEPDAERCGITSLR